MAQQTVVLRNPSGLHARPAERFAREANRFEMDITVSKRAGDNSVNAKSVLSVLTLDCLQGDEITILAEGEEAEQAVAYLSRLVEEGLGEDLVR
jgi:phosphocarrier protein HPr